VSLFFLLSHTPKQITLGESMPEVGLRVGNSGAGMSSASLNPSLTPCSPTGSFFPHSPSLLVSLWWVHMCLPCREFWLTHVLGIKQRAFVLGRCLCWAVMQVLGQPLQHQHKRALLGRQLGRFYSSDLRSADLQHGSAM